MTNKEKALLVLIEHRHTSISVRQMAAAVGVNYERNWNKRAPRIARGLTSRGYAIRVIDGRSVFLTLDPRWAHLDAAAILRAFREGADQLASCRALPPHVEVLESADIAG